MNISQVRELLQKYQQGSCTAAEIELVESWYKQLIETGEWQWNGGEKEMMQHILEARIMKQIDDSAKKAQAPVFASPRFRWWAAASVVALVGTLSYFMFFTGTSKPAPIAKVLPNDIKAPQVNRAMITLANGQKIYLDSSRNGSLAVQGNVQLVKLASGQISYQHESGTNSGKMEYNTLSNPKGSKVINMVLSDGSKVWLNAGSSLTYPVSFMGSERRVSVEGESYFEVAHNASMPFIVKNGTVDIRVLGTHFNVNAFHDDGEDVKVTLLEGSVKINNANATGLLKPGQQALVNNNVKIKNDVDLDLVMAWKNGYFQFANSSLQNVLKELSRWYDVNVVYEGKNQPRQFVGEIQRDLNLTEVLKILEKNKVHFKIEGKNLIVMAD
jgi:transmembrane sensor